MDLLDTSVTQVNSLSQQKGQQKDFCWITELNQQAEETEDQAEGSKQEGEKEQRFPPFQHP